MTIPKKLPSRKLLRAALRYEPKTGLLYWRKRADASKDWNSKFSGKKAGTVLKSGAIRVSLCDIPYAAHRIIWKMIYGVVPSLVDHKNSLAGDNRRRNLRGANYTKNNWNRRPKKGRSLPKWVIADHGKYKSRIVVNGKAYNLGMFTEPKDAHKAACAIARKLHGKFFRAA